MHAGSLLKTAGRRIAVHWVAKMVGTTVAMSAFFAVYFWLLNHSRGSVTTVPRIWLDRMIPFQPWALALYASLWVYVSLAPSLLVSGRALVSYAAAAVALSVAGFGVFILWPTTVPPPEVDPSHAGSLAFLKAVDASGNAFPSLHVAFAVFTAIWFERLLREMGAGSLVRAVNWLWCAGILYSTMATRQHVALDVLAGAALGAIVATAHMRWLGKIQPG